MKAMPRRPALPCKHPNCPRLVPYGSKYCEEHSHLHSLEVKSTKEKGYDSRWNKARLRFLKLHPFCIRCLKRNRYKQATVVDHIVPHRGNQKLLWDEGNWQPLCKSCHDHKTVTEDHTPIYGYDF